MQFTFAMAGLAEAAFLFGLLIIGAILFIVGGLLAFAWWKCSNVAASIVIFLILSVGLFLQPWAAFAPPATNDPDEAYWIVRFRVASGVWLLFLIAGVACLIRVTRRRRLQT